MNAQAQINAVRPNWILRALSAIWFGLFAAAQVICVHCAYPEDYGLEIGMAPIQIAVATLLGYCFAVRIHVLSQAQRFVLRLLGIILTLLICEVVLVTVLFGLITLFTRGPSFAAISFILAPPIFLILHGAWNLLRWTIAVPILFLIFRMIVRRANNTSEGIQQPGDGSPKPSM